MLTAPNRSGRALPIVLVLVAAGGGVATGYFLAGWLPPGSARPDARTPPDQREKITALGRLQPASGVVAVYGPPGDRIGKLYRVPDVIPDKNGMATPGKEKDVALAPGVYLAADTPIGELASRPQRQIEFDVAKTQLKEAKAQHAAAKRAGEQKILAAQAELNQAVANRESDLKAIDAKIGYLELQVKSAENQLVRVQKGGAAAEIIDQNRLLVEQAKAELEANKALRKKTEITYIESEKAAKAKLEAAEAELSESLARVPLESAEVRLKLAEETFALTIIKAPVSGVVLKVVGREGQQTGIEPILQMADLRSMTVVAEVYESDVRQLVEWVGAGPVPVEVTNPALSRPLKGEVRSESDVTRMIARNQVFAVGPREDADRRVVEVIVHLDADSAPVASRFVGLQVSATFTPRK